MTSDPTGVGERCRQIRRRIEEACERCGRDAATVTLVGASKRQPPEILRAARAAGVTVFGENRVQEAEAHAQILAGEADLEWHLIGPLQSNKARAAAELFDVVHSVDRPKIARALNREAGRLGKVLPCLIEVNLGNEGSKHGFAAQGLTAQRLAAALAPLTELTHLPIRGLMAIPPFDAEPEASRRWFQALRGLRDELAAALGDRLGWNDGGWLSMGMSNDFEVAIEEGATHVRVGTALFGSRSES